MINSSAILLPQKWEVFSFIRHLFWYVRNSRQIYIFCLRRVLLCGVKWKFPHKFQRTWLTGPTFVARNHEQIFLDCNSSTFNVKFESTISTANKLMVSCNCSFAEYTWVLHRSWVRMNTVEWNFTWIITSISVWTTIDYTTKKTFCHPTSGCYIAISCSRWTPNFAYEKEKDKKPERTKLMRWPAAIFVNCFYLQVNKILLIR